MKINITVEKLKKNKQDLVSIFNLPNDDLLKIFELTKNFKKTPYMSKEFLSGKNIALVFAKPSLRTRVSFEVGINHLGGNPITIKMDEISVGIRENVEDIASVLSRYVNGIVIRTFEQKQINDLANYSSVPVINALSDDEHPCQVISDLFTIQEVFGKLRDLKIAYIGDGNNVANSLLLICAKAGINISVATPKSYEPKKYYLDAARKINSKIKLEVTNDPISAVNDANVVYTDVWTSMGQESEIENRKAIFSPYQVNEKLLSASKNAIVLHCLPAHKGEEISEGSFNKFKELIYTQAENRLHAQKAILYSLLSANA